MSSQLVFIIDKDGVSKPCQKSLLLRQYQLGNLSDKLQISQNGDNFEPLAAAAWFFEDDSQEKQPNYSLSTSSSPTSPPPSLSRGSSPPSLNLLSSSGVPGYMFGFELDSKPPHLARKSSVSRLKPPSIKSSLFSLKTSYSVNSSLRNRDATAGQTNTLGQRAELLSSSSPTSPGKLTFSDRPNDVLEAFRILTSELSSSLSRTEGLRYDYENSLASVKSDYDELLKENASLKAQVQKYEEIIQEHAPGALHVDQPPSSPQDSSPSFATIHSHESEGEEKDNGFAGIPFDADSPMLREKMDSFEAQLDGVRQSMKSCVKSGSAFVQSFALFFETGIQFTDDLQHSSLPMLKVLGETIAAELEQQSIHIDQVQNEFMHPLSKFANNDLKSANHIRAELERKKEIFESMESKYMSGKRGGKDKNASFQGSVMGIAENRSFSRSSSTNVPPVSVESDDRKNELKASEMQYELSRCKLIFTLNKLAMNHRVVVNRCVSSLANSLSAFHESGGNRVQALLENAKVLGMRDPVEIEKVIEQSEAQFRVKQEELEKFVFRCPQRNNAEQDLIYEGWLWKRSSNVIRDWKKRFFQIGVNGQLAYFRNNSREVVGEAHLCTVREIPRTTGRESSPPKNAFEVISNKRALVLMASSEEEKEIWIASIRTAIEKGLGQSSQELTETREEGVEALMAALIQDDANHRCFECQAPTPINWVSLNLGVFLCIGCSGIHRSLGSHVSKVRSLSLDNRQPIHLEILKRLGNARAGKVWEAKASVVSVKRGLGLNQFVRDKYIAGAFLSEDDVDLSNFEAAILDDSLKGVMWFVARMKPPFLVRGSTTALHIAASVPNVSAAIMEYLLLNGSDLSATDESGKTPSDVAQEKGAVNAEVLLRKWAAESHFKGVLVDDV